MSHALHVAKAKTDEKLTPEEQALAILHFARVFSQGCGETQRLDGDTPLTEVSKITGIEMHTGKPETCNECCVQFLAIVGTTLRGIKLNFQVDTPIEEQVI